MGYLLVVQYLIAHGGATVEAKMSDGTTPLYVSAGKIPDVINKLL